MGYLLMPNFINHWRRGLFLRNTLDFNQPHDGAGIKKKSVSACLPFFLFSSYASHAK